MGISGSTAEGLTRAPGRTAAPVRLPRHAAPVAAARWGRALVVVGVVAGAIAVWLTLRAGFLEHPGWLAAQKADLILGPIGVGLYWHHRRPHSRFGVMLIVLGLLSVLYVLQSADDPALFRIGVLAEDPIWVWTTVVILAFPSGRLDGLPERLVIGLNVVTAIIVTYLFWPPSNAGFTISGCSGQCPGNGGGTSYADSWLVRNQVVAAVPVVIALATAAVIVWRFATGTPPRRRALAIGAPIALLFVLSEATYRGLFLFRPEGLPDAWRPLQDGLLWTPAGTRSLVWYGFLFALIAAELYAARVLRTLVGDALRRPSLGDLGAMLRRPLGDPGLRLGVRRTAERGWVDAEGVVLEPALGQRLTEFARDPGLAVAIVHDEQLSDDPELLTTAAELALLSLEHTALEAAQLRSLRELAESRARLVDASDRERRKLERDLHDGAQARLTAIQIRLDLAREQAADERLAGELDAISLDASAAIDELRTLSHGIYPTVLRSMGLVAALRSLAMTATIPVAVTDDGIGRHPAAVEAAIYFCCSEALQNAMKHAGAGATVSIDLRHDREGIRVTIADDGVGMDERTARAGDGLVGMRDRIGAVGGLLEITSAPGCGTTLRGSVPVSGLADGARSAAP